MASQSEVGHARNVANLQKLIQQITAYTLYNPPVPALQVTSLQTLHTAAVAKLADLENSRIANKAAIAARQEAFENLKPLSTRIINFLDILGVSEGILGQARSLNRAIQGYTSRAVTATPPGEEGNTVSTSRQSYTQQAENFGNLISLLKSIPQYVPNENDLKLPALTAYQQSLVDATLPVDQTEAELKVELIQRNELLYAEGTGLTDLAQKVKKYVKSIYGGDSPEYSAVADIKFTNPTR